MSPTWHDLLGISWKSHGTGKDGMDCSTVAEEILRRMGAALPETSPYRAKYDGGESELGSFLAYMDNGFDRVGGEVKHATMVGDVVIGADDDGNGKHMYIRVEEHRSVFLTANHKYGVVAVRGFSIQNPLGVYRLRRGTES